MTNQQSPLDSLNMRRERRPLASLDELNRTLAALEDHLRSRKYNEENTPLPAQSGAEPMQDLQHQAGFSPQDYAAQPAQKASTADNPHQHALAEIAEELQRLRAIDELKQAAAISDHLQTSGSSHQPLSSAERFIAGTSRYTGNISQSDNTDRIMRRDFEELKRTVETLAREETLRRMSHRWDALDERFDNFAQEQSEKLQAQQAIDPALDAISTRLEDIRRMIVQLPDDQNRSLQQLDERLNEISRAILAASYQRPQAEEARIAEELDRRFAALTDYLDEQYQNSLHKNALNDDRFIEALENRLDHITRQVSEQTAFIQNTPVAEAADQQLLRNLEKQLAFITEHLGKPERLVPELAEIKPRLDEIERSIDISRDTVLNAAREAAEEAIRQAVHKSPAEETELARQLANDLKALEKLTRDTNAQNSRSFERVQDTLLKIADRLAQIEKGSLHKAPHLRPASLNIQENKERFINQFSFPEQDSAPFTGLNNALIRNNAGDEAAPAEKKSFLSGLAKAVRGKKPEAAPSADADDFYIDDADLQPEAGTGSLLSQTRPLKTSEQSEHIPAAQTLAAMPDLNAIIRRVRDEQRGRNAGMSSQDGGKAELISAARRTLQAAAEETGRLRDQDEPAETGNTPCKDDLCAGAEPVAEQNKPKRSLRKPLLLAICAIIMAGTGLQLGHSYLAERDSFLTKQQPDASRNQPAITQPAAKKSGQPLPAQPLSAKPLSVMPAKPDIASAPEQEKLAQLPAQPAVLMPDSAQKPDNITTQAISPKETAAATPEPEVREKAEEKAETAVEKLKPIPAIAPEAGPDALRKAAENGDARALYAIGVRYTDGIGVTSNFTEAAKWYELSAERGFAPAQYRLGNFNEKGLGMPRDIAKAAGFYEQAAKQGNASAMHNLAVLHAMGTDGKADNLAAAKWFFKAAELGIKDSQFNLGILAAKGLGMPQNLEESYKWFALAADAGDADAAEKRDQIAKSMRPDQLERATKLVRLWKPKPLIEEANNVTIPADWNDEKTVTTASVDMKKAVRNIQLILQKNGYDTGAADGLMGAKTRHAIAAFQKDNGMKATGEVDQRLVEALLAKNS
ncbi:peptidoglycan-binding protein [Pseudochrobactrum sp. HB0163]|uniref:peptidoglycan-binding protein n=1 Tax=Pseudochrobactrum sp. HB0163 TaxID=3450708 RepID=UPI003F6DE3C3